MLVLGAGVGIARLLRWRRARQGENGAFALMTTRDWQYFGCAASASLASLLVVAKAAYVVLLVLALVVYCVAAVAWGWRTWVTPRIPRMRTAAGWVLAGLALVPWLLPPAALPPRITLRTMLALRSVWEAQPAKTEWRMLEADGGWCTYLDVARCTWVESHLKRRAVPWSRFLRENRINSVVVSQRLIADAAYRDDPEFREFYLRPAGRGFRPVFRNELAILFLSDAPPPPHPASTGAQGVPSAADLSPVVR